VRIIVHPKHPAPEWMELQVPDEWAVEVENETDHILTLTHDNGAGTLQLSLAPQHYQPGMGLPQLMGMAERLASSSGGHVFGHAAWRRGPKGSEDTPPDDKGARSPDDVLACTAATVDEGYFVQFFFILQRTSLAFATYVCDSDIQPGKLEYASEILRTIEIKRLIVS
jgi:hypothetical protein